MKDPEILIIFADSKTYVLMKDDDETRPPAKPVRFEGIETADPVEADSVGLFFLGSCIVIGALLWLLSTLR